MTRKQIFVRTMLTLGLPLILLWAFVETLLREMRFAFRHAWLETRMNLDAYHRQMKRRDY